VGRDLAEGDTEHVNSPARVPVLVVDDQRPFRVAARAVLRRAGIFDVVGEAETGEQAVQQASVLRPALILMDVRLPGISGVEAASQIVATAPDTVVVLCSTYQQLDLPDGLVGAAAYYLNKEELRPELVRRMWDDAQAAPASG
jgi:DNA-binding NarL/FixJ family response regulator